MSMDLGTTTDKLRRFVRDYTDGLSVKDFTRLVGVDASRAYGVLTREHAGEEPEGRFKRAWHRARILFLGLSYKLSPARRILFLVCMVLALVGLVRDSEQLDATNEKLLLGLSVAGLTLLLGLELADRVLVRDELEVARALQRALLPEQPPEVPGYHFAFSSRTANTIGGDIYDLLPLTDGRLAVVVGDASGHGIAAGLLMAISSSTLKLALDTDPSPLAALNMLNTALVRTGDRRAFMTLFYGLLDPPSGRLEFALAGHPFPILRRASGSVEELGSGSLPLGIRRQIEPFAGSVELAPGDLLTIVTDGIPEALDSAGRSFGFDRLRSVVATGGTAREIHDRVISSVTGFVGDHPADDDRSLVVLAREPTPPAPPPPDPA